MIRRVVVSFIVGFILWWAGVAVLGAILHPPPGERAPVAAQRAVEARQQEEVRREGEEEEAREARYAAQPGPPYPVKSFSP
jgi:hypothetical protein